MFNSSKLVTDPKVLIAGLSIAVLYQVMHKLVNIKVAFILKNREIFFLLTIILLLAPVYFHNSTFFTISPDSQGLLRSPAENTTYRPPLLWGAYRLFASQKEIDQFFKSQPKSGEKLNYNEILQGSNFVMAGYLTSLAILLWVFYKYLKIDARLLVMVVLIQTSGPLYYLSDYFYIPNFLVPVYKLLFYFLLSNFLLSKVSKLLYKSPKKKLDYLKSAVVLCSGSVLLLISTRSSLMVDELNQVMTETLTITLINLTLALCVTLLTSANKMLLRYAAIALGLSTGLLMIIKLSTVLTPLIILIFISVLKIPVKEKIVASTLFLIIAISPSVTSSVIGANSETSQTWYGLVAYAIEFQSEQPLNLKISPDAGELLESALRKRAETWEKYPEIVREYDFTYQKTPISLFYGALPAAQELGFGRVSQDYTSELFKEISISSFHAHKSLVVRALAENLKVPSGLFKLDGQYMSMSKIFKNPIVYAMFFAIFIIYFSRRAHPDFLLVLLIFSFSIINYLVVSIFNGPIPRYFYLYDPLLLYSIIIMWSKCLSQEVECNK